MIDPQTRLPLSAFTVGDARFKLAGWNSALNAAGGAVDSREVLTVAAGLLRLLDEREFRSALDQGLITSAMPFFEEGCVIRAALGQRSVVDGVTVLARDVEVFVDHMHQPDVVALSVGGRNGEGVGYLWLRRRGMGLGAPPLDGCEVDVVVTDPHTGNVIRSYSITECEWTCDWLLDAGERWSFCGIPCRSSAQPDDPGKDHSPPPSPGAFRGQVVRTGGKHRCNPLADIPWRTEPGTVWECPCGIRWKYRAPGNPLFEGWSMTCPSRLGLHHRAKP